MDILYRSVVRQHVMQKDAINSKPATKSSSSRDTSKSKGTVQEASPHGISTPSQPIWDDVYFGSSRNANHEPVQNACSRVTHHLYLGLTLTLWLLLRFAVLLCNSPFPIRCLLCEPCGCVILLQAGLSSVSYS